MIGLRRLFVLSVDSLFVEDMGWLEDCPNLLEIYERSARVKRMESTFPAMTYVAHSTMLTGCCPEKHGIYHNEKLCVGDPHPEWHWYRRDLQVPTIVDAAYSAGYRSAVVNWPVTGADPHIAFDIPEIWADTQEGDVRPRFLSVCSEPIIALFDRHRHLLNWDFLPELDEFGVTCLADVVREHQPECIFLHLSYLDYCRHRFGRYSEKAKQALEECDERFGRIVKILKELGLHEDTDFVVVGDHGHMPITQTFHPNVLLAQEGLIELDQHGQIRSWKAYCHSAGLTCHVTLANPEDNQLREKMRGLLSLWCAESQYGCERFFCKEDIVETYHLDGPIDYVIDGAEGTAFGNNCTGKPFYRLGDPDVKMNCSGHGHIPTKGPQPTFFAAGPHIRPGVVLQNAKLIDEAPTWASILGVELPTAQGRVLKELLR